ncbi:unnamed protein product [Urochloa humidicola]
MDAEEDRLRFALLAAAPPGYPRIPVEAMRRAVADIPGVGEDHFTVRRFAPESFLVVFGSQRARDHAQRAAFVPVGGVRVYFRQWTRLIRAALQSLRFRVSLEIEGVPAHAWGMDVAQRILGSSCWVERLEASSESRADMSTLALTAWTDRPCRIPKEATVFIAEHELPVVHNDPDMQRIFANVKPYLREKGVLRYETIIHLRSYADFRSRSPSPRPGPSPPSSDGDSGHDGNPDRGYGESGGDGGPRLQGFPCYPGVPDGQPPLNDGASCSRQASLQDVAPTSTLHQDSGPFKAAPPLVALRPVGAAEDRVPDITAAPESTSAPAGETIREASVTQGTIATSAAVLYQSICLDTEGPIAALVSSARSDKEEAPTATALADQLEVLGHLSSRDPSESTGAGLGPLHGPQAGAAKGGREFVSFEDQRPARYEPPPLQWDPMLFELSAPTPKRISPREDDKSRRLQKPLKTYRRRTRLGGSELSPAPPSEPETSELPPEEAVGPAAPASRKRAMPSTTHQEADLDGPEHDGPTPSDLDEQGGGPEASTEKRARPIEPTLQEAQAATAAFLASVSQALQVPLASLPERRGGGQTAAPSTPAPRRSGRLASQALNSTMRASKRGEILVMKKMGYHTGDGQTSG